MRDNWMGGGGGFSQDLVAEALSCIPLPAWLVRVRPDARLEKSNTAGRARLVETPGHLEPAILALALGARLPEPFEGGLVLEHGELRWALVVESMSPTSRLVRLQERWNLTPRQAEVTTLVLDGRSNKDIAETLKTSVRTVEVHVSAVLRRMNVGSRSELMARYFRDVRDPRPVSDGRAGAARSKGGAPRPPFPDGDPG